MNRSHFSRLLMVATAALLCFGFTGCGPNFGEKVVVDGTEIYYKDGAKKEDVDKLAEMLKNEGFVDGKKKSVQLLKRGNVWEFRMAVGKNSQKDKEVQESVKRLLLQISAALDGAEVEIHLCTPKLESVSVVKGLSGKKYTFDNTNVYYRDISLEQSKAIVAILFASSFASEPGIDFHFSQPASTVKIKMATTATINSQQMKMFATSVVQAASKKVFDGNVVEFEVCDPFFSTQSIISSKQFNVGGAGPIDTTPINTSPSGTAPNGTNPTGIDPVGGIAPLGGSN